jgi:hypothetical protein
VYFSVKHKFQSNRIIINLINKCSISVVTMNSCLGRYSRMEVGEGKGKFQPRTGREDPEG